MFFWMLVLGIVLFFLGLCGMAWCSADTFPNLKVEGVIALMVICGMILVLLGGYFGGYLH